MVLLGAAHAPAAPPKVSGFFPGGVARGQTATITASGEFSAWPVDIWVDRPGLVVTAETEKGKLKAVAAADAEPGIYWLRLTHAEGASALRPLVVGVGTEVEETEPNDTPDKPQILSGTTVVHGRLGKGGDVDTFAVRLRKGEPLTAALEANVPFGSPMDGVLQIVWLAGPAYDDAGPAIAPSATSSRRLDAFVLAQDDDGAGLDPRVSLVAPRDGWYAVRAFAFPAEPNSTVAFAGAETYVYRLTVSTTGLVEHAWPLAASAGQTVALRFGGWHLPASATQDRSLAIPPRDPAQPGVLDQRDVALEGVPGSARVRRIEGASFIAADASDPQSPQAITVPAVVSGRIETPRDVDAFSFAAVKGRKIRMAVESRGMGFPLDALLQVTDTAGKTLVENDDIGKGRDPELVFSPPADGQYVVAVRDVHRHGGPRYVYRLTLTDAALDFGLSLAADSFVLPADKPLEIPVTVDRRDGLDQPIEISLQGLPAGVTTTSVVSEPKGDSAKAVKLVLNAEPGAKFAARGVPVRIIGRVTAEAPRWRAATFATGPGQVLHQDVWLALPGP